MTSVETEKRYYAFYSPKQVQHTKRVFYYLDETEGNNVRCSCVASFDKYATSAEAQKDVCQFDDAVYCGIVDKWMQTE